MLLLFFALCVCSCPKQSRQKKWQQDSPNKVRVSNIGGIHFLRDKTSCIVGSALTGTADPKGMMLTAAPFTSFIAFNVSKGTECWETWPMRQKFVKNCVYEKWEDDSFENLWKTCQHCISVWRWRERKRAVQLCMQLSRSVHLHWLIALFGFKVTYADGVSAPGLTSSVSNWLPPAFAKTASLVWFFFLGFGLILCPLHHLGLGIKQNFQCLGATGLAGLAAEYEPTLGKCFFLNWLFDTTTRTIKNQGKATSAVHVSNMQCRQSEEMGVSNWVDFPCRDQVMVSEEVPGAQRVQRCRFGCFKYLPSTLFQVTKTGGDMR